VTAKPRRCPLSLARSRHNFPHARLLLLSPACCTDCLPRGARCLAATERAAAAQAVCAAALTRTLTLRACVNAGMPVRRALDSWFCAALPPSTAVPLWRGSAGRPRARWALAAAAPRRHDQRVSVAACCGAWRRSKPPLLASPAARFAGLAHVPLDAASSRAVHTAAVTRSSFPHTPKALACPNARAAVCHTRVCRALLCVSGSQACAPWATTARSSCSRAACLRTATSVQSATMSCATQPPACKATGACVQPCATLPCATLLVAYLRAAFAWRHWPLTAACAPDP
jgi:hypothetical protein